MHRVTENFFGAFAGALALSWIATGACFADGVFIRVRMDVPEGTRYHVVLGGFIHNDPWYLPTAVIPEKADREPALRIPSGQFTPWFDLGRHAGKLLHGRLARAGGVAELPNVTLSFQAEDPSPRRAVTIELAAAPDEARTVRRFQESFEGNLTSVLVSPDLERDAGSLETASEMTLRRLRWAREASGGRRASPKDLIVQTSFWAPQRPELNLLEAEVLHLLGFNVVGNQREEVRGKFGFHVPGHTHDVDLGPGAAREAIDANMKAHAARDREKYARGVPYGFSDEVCARPPIGEDPAALANFRAWLAGKGIPPEDLGARRLEEVAPIETPADLKKRQEANDRAARRVFYYTSRFRQEAANERLRWTTEAFHRHFGDGPVTSTLVADHPYFSGTGLGMGMTGNWTWGGHPLALDWFLLGRTRAVDLAGIEDWMGLQYMYGPDSTWEGFQLLGFQAAIFRSASRGAIPIIAWITPSDERNLRLKSASALCQGARNFFYWTYGPTATSTENYWSDLRGAYDGIAKMARQLAAAEHIIAPGKLRTTRLALLYSISSDLWQPFGYVHMLERRGTYLSLVHDQYLVDFLAEEDIEAGRLKEYDVLYATDPCIARKAAEAIRDWVKAGGHLYGSCAAGSLDEFGEPSAALAEVFGIDPAVAAQAQPGRYDVRCGVNGIPYADRIEFLEPVAAGAAREIGALGVIGAKVSFNVRGARIVGRFSGGKPAVATNGFGAGKAIYAGACPGIAYIKEANFIPRELAEKWPEGLRRFIDAAARDRGVPRLAELSHAVVEAGAYDSERGTALVLANFTYEPIPKLEVRLPVKKSPASVRSAERGALEFAFEFVREDLPGGGEFPCAVEFTLELGLNDIVLIE